MRIKIRREKLSLRQADIAGALQISAQAVSKWERGENAPDISILASLARLLGVSIEWLLGGTTGEADTFSATVFYSTLNGFAEKAASMPPRDVAAWANSVYFTVTEALLRFDGIPVKYMGDGFLGFFAGTDQAKRALSAARQSIDLLNTRDLVVTLHAGAIYLGTMGHPDYARPDIMGETVNSAFLIMPFVAKNCKSGIGVTKYVHDNLSDKTGLSKAGEVSILGQDKPITLFEGCS